MSNIAREGRRRRLLHEGASEPASDSHSKSTTNGASEGTACRYAPRNESASFAVARRVLPQSWGGGGVVAMGLASVLALLLLADSYFASVVAGYSPEAARWLLVGLPATFASWWAASLWLVIAATTLLLFGLRRQRMNDLRCHYRWWLVATGAAVLMSLNAATHAHQIVAKQLAQLIGWSPLGGDTFWWLVPGGFVLGLIAARMVLDLAESRIAIAVALLAMGVTGGGWLIEAGATPQILAEQLPVTATPQFGPLLSLGGVSLALLALLLYSRRIVLEANGVIAPPNTKSATPVKKKRQRSAPELSTSEPPKQQAKPSPARKTAARVDDSTKEGSRSRQATAKRAETPNPTSSKTTWVSGEENGYRDEYEENDAPRKLSKAERKRLRKQNMRRAA